MPDTLSTSRMEAFSDGVIAVIITIMVLELKAPAREISDIAGLRATLPLLLVYLLSFVQTGIYWVNHHYLLDDAKGATHGLLWANLAFLFCLSLFPFATAWVGTRGVTSFSVALYAAVSVLPAFAWMIFSILLGRSTGQPVLNSRVKQAASSLLYLGAIPMAYVRPSLGLGMICIVAILWLVPPRGVLEKTRALKATEPPHSQSR